MKKLGQNMNVQSAVWGVFQSLSQAVSHKTAFLTLSNATMVQTDHTTMILFQISSVNLMKGL